MKFTRREALALGLGATAVAMLPMRASAAADEAIAAFTGGAEVGAAGITLTAPEIAENATPSRCQLTHRGRLRSSFWQAATRPRVWRSSTSALPLVRRRPRPAFVWLAPKMWLPLPRWPTAALFRRNRP